MQVNHNGLVPFEEVFLHIFLKTGVDHPWDPCTFLVKLPEAEPTMARLVTRPLNADWTELMKLDFPEPTGPRRRTRAWVTSSLLGL